jgi:hypothetical protein
MPNDRRARRIFSAATRLIALALAMAAVGCAPRQIPTAAPASQPTPWATPTLAVGPAPAGQVDLTPPGAKGDPTCPGVQSQLLGVVRATDVAAVAKSQGLRLQGERLLVAITLADEATAFLAAYDVEVTGQAGQAVQAWIPVDRMCELARDARVLAIKAPAAAVMP